MGKKIKNSKREKENNNRIGASLGNRSIMPKKYVNNNNMQSDKSENDAKNDTTEGLDETSDNKDKES